MLVEPLLRRLDELGLPHAIFVNKIENARAGAVRELVAELQPMSREPLALRQIPIREGEQPHPVRTRGVSERTFRMGHGPINQLFVTGL